MLQIEALDQWQMVFLVCSHFTKFACCVRCLHALLSSLLSILRVVDMAIFSRCRLSSSFGDICFCRPSSWLRHSKTSILTSSAAFDLVWCLCLWICACTRPTMPEHLCFCLFASLPLKVFLSEYLFKKFEYQISCRYNAIRKMWI